MTYTEKGWYRPHLPDPWDLFSEYTPPPPPMVGYFNVYNDGENVFVGGRHITREMAGSSVALATFKITRTGSKIDVEVVS